MFPLLLHKRNRQKKSAARRQKPKAVQHASYASTSKTSSPAVESYSNTSPDLQLQNAHHISRNEGPLTDTMATATVLSCAACVTYPVCNNSCLFHDGKPEQSHEYLSSFKRSDSRSNVNQADLCSIQNNIVDSESDVSAQVKPFNTMTLKDEELSPQIPPTDRIVSSDFDAQTFAILKDNHAFESSWNNMSINKLDNCNVISETPCMCSQNRPLDSIKSVTDSQDGCADHPVSAFEHFTSGGKPSQKTSMDTTKPNIGLLNSNEDQTIRSEIVECSIPEGNKLTRGNEVLNTAASFFTNSGRSRKRVKTSTFQLCSLSHGTSISPSVSLIGQPKAIKCWQNDSTVNEQLSEVSCALLASFTTDVIPLLPLVCSLTNDDVESNVQQVSAPNKLSTAGRLSREESTVARFIPKTETEERPTWIHIVETHNAFQKLDEMHTVNHNTNHNGFCENHYSTDNRSLFQTPKENNSQLSVPKSDSSINKQMKDASTQISTRRIRKKTMVSRATQTLPMRKKKSRQPAVNLAPPTPSNHDDDVKDDPLTVSVKQETSALDRIHTPDQHLTNCECNQQCTWESNKRIEMTPNIDTKEASIESDVLIHVPLSNKINCSNIPCTDLKEHVPLSNKTNCSHIPCADIMEPLNPEKDMPLKQMNHNIWLPKPADEDSFRKTKTSENVKTSKPQVVKPLPLSQDFKVNRIFINEELKQKKNSSDLIPSQTEMTDKLSSKLDLQTKGTKREHSILDRASITIAKSNVLSPPTSIGYQSTFNRLLPLASISTLESAEPMHDAFSGSSSMLPHSSCTMIHYNKVKPISCSKSTPGANKPVPVASESLKQLSEGSPDSAGEYKRPLPHLSQSSFPVSSVCESASPVLGITSSTFTSCSSRPPLNSSSYSPKHSKYVSKNVFTTKFSCSLAGPKNSKSGSKNICSPKSNFSMAGTKYSKLGSRNISLPKSNSSLLGFSDSKLESKSISTPGSCISGSRSESSLHGSNTSRPGFNRSRPGSNSVIRELSSSTLNGQSPTSFSGSARGANDLLPRLSSNSLSNRMIPRASYSHTRGSYSLLSGGSGATPIANIPTVESNNSSTGCECVVPESNVSIPESTSSQSGLKNPKSGPNTQGSKQFTTESNTVRLDVISSLGRSITETTTRQSRSALKTDTRQYDTVGKNEDRACQKENIKRVTGNGIKALGKKPEQNQPVMASKQNLIQPHRITEQTGMQSEMTSDQNMSQPGIASNHNVAQSEMTTKQYVRKPRKQNGVELEMTSKQNMTKSETTKQKVAESDITFKQNMAKPEMTPEQNVTHLEMTTKQSVAQPKTTPENLAPREITRERTFSVTGTTKCLSSVSDKRYMQLIADDSLPLQTDVSRWQKLFGLQADVVAAGAMRLLAGDVTDVCEGLSLEEEESVQKMRKQMQKMTDTELLDSIAEHK